MRKIVLSLMGLALTAGFSANAFAAAEKYILDKPHTQIVFIVDHAGFSKSYGKFADYSGFINLDQAEPAKSSVEVTIQTASIDLSDQKWDDHLKGPDFFNVEKFPAMTFKSTKVEVTGEKTANVTGDLTLLGVTKPVTLAVTHYQTGKHPFNPKMSTGFSATGTIKRSEFGMGYGLPVIGDDIAIHIEAEANLEDKAAGGVDNP